MPYREASLAANAGGAGAPSAHVAGVRMIRGRTAALARGTGLVHTIAVVG